VLNLLFVWTMLTTPTDRLICSMWLSVPPTAADVRAACGTLQSVDKLTVQAVEITTGRTVCEQPASDLPTLTCDLWPLSNYRLTVVHKKFQEHVCTLRVSHEGEPTSAEIAAQCPQAPTQYVLIFEGKQDTGPDPEPACSPPPLTTGDGPDQLPADPVGLATSDRLQYLAGRLLWYGIATPNCDGWSGVNPQNGMATECGMDSALVQVGGWQNLLDHAIWQAGAAHNVPPRRMKQILLIESQMWPLAVGTDGERGMMQLSEAGADFILRASPDLYAEFCPQAIFPSRCTEQRYDTLNQWERENVRLALLAKLTTAGSTPLTALRSANMDLFARMLAGAWCGVQSTPHPDWEGVLAAWHSGFSCVAGAEICQDGQEYLR
jgi:hypothetical protein